jgi:hypothetical protein
VRVKQQKNEKLIQRERRGDFFFQNPNTTKLCPV